MKGLFKIYTKTGRAAFELTVKSKITVIDDDSGTGKTTFVDSVSAGILKCSVPVHVLVGLEREPLLVLTALKSYSGSIIIFDDPDSSINSRDFIQAINSSDNYFIIFSHDKVRSLTYDVADIYTMFYDGNITRNVPKYKDLR